MPTTTYLCPRCLGKSASESLLVAHLQSVHGWSRWEIEVIWGLTATDSGEETE